MIHYHYKQQFGAFTNMRAGIEDQFDRMKANILVGVPSGLVEYSGGAEFKFSSEQIRERQIANIITFCAKQENGEYIFDQESA
jgi:hypothetical protein